MFNCLLRRTFPNTIAIRKSLLLRSYADTSKSVDLAESDRPVKFSTSPASRYRASLSTRGEINSRLWYEPYVIIASITCFLVYFGYLREENDLDETLRTPLYETVQGLEKIQLENFIQYSTSGNEDVIRAKQRLKELDEASKLTK